MSTYKIDAMHSEIAFKVKHLVITTVTGHFAKYDATVISEKPDFSDASISFEADVNSISTKNEQRDEHLKGEDFFDAANFPKITFKSGSIEKKGDEGFVLKGALTIHGVTNPVSLDVSYNGSAVFYGQTKYGFDITGKISRKDFGLKWNALTEAGGVAVSDEVRLELNIQLIKQD